MATIPAPDWLCGLWRRTAVEGPDVTAEERGRDAWWGQTPHGFVDLRVPRPDAAEAGVEGFAGHLSLDGDLCTWHRTIDLSPGGPADRARLGRVGDALHETGDGYAERFALARAGRQRCLGFRADGPEAILVVIDDVFLCATAGPGPVEVAMGQAGDGWRIAAATDARRRGEHFFDDDPAVPHTGPLLARRHGRPVRFEPLNVQPTFPDREEPT